jgi:hypothetical protein
MPGIWNQEFLNMNSQRAYPLFESATRRDLTGTFTLPDDFLLALHLPVHAGLDVDPERFFIRSVSVFAGGYNVAIGYDDGSDDPPVAATAVVARDTHREYDSYALPGAGDFDDILGKIALGGTAGIDLQPAGRYLFDRAGGQLDPDCVRPIIRGVSSISVVNGNERSPRLYGDFEFVSGTNMQISVVSAGDINQIRWDAIDGAGLTEDCACEENIGPPIRTINNIPPTPDGNFTLIGNACLEVLEAGNGLRLNDKCSQPCCGCPELEKLTRELAQFGDQAATLQAFTDRLQKEVYTMRDSLMASRLNSSGCSTC